MTIGRSELATEINPPLSAMTVDNDLRVVSVTIAAYDYLVTLPAEYRLYRSSNRRNSGLVLFVLIRYTSIIVLVVSNVGFFYRGFTSNSCDHFHLAVPSLKGTSNPGYSVSPGLTSFVSSLMLGSRAYNISQRKPWVGRTLLSVYIVATGFQWFSSLFSRIRDCTTGSVHPQRAISTWSFYLVAMLFDCLTLSISTFYLMKVRAVASAILYDGLGYFVVLTLMNATNIVLFRGTNHAIQTSGYFLIFCSPSLPGALL
ncbi:hypothetical protein BJY52DRAFT_1264371 [Lactarius psammicola]|nr:hypothetical protein BJY52DRAFT_1264371 [Lactarius psammicola]